MIDAVRKLVAPLQRRVALMVGRGVIRLVNDALKAQTVQIDLLAGETLTGVERLQQYGFSSVPLPGAEAVAVFPGGQRHHGIVIAVDDRRYRLAGLQGGEVALYTDEGDHLILKRGNTIEITTQHAVVNATTDATVTTPVLTVKASTKARFETPVLQCTGAITDHVP